MASRRTRIKGIANIPQRRKTGPTTTDPEDNLKPPSEIEHKEEEKPNLTLQHDSPLEEESPKPVLITETVQNALNTSVLKEEENNLTAVEKIEEKIAPPVRRKFIKPTVSLNAINRKLKDEDGIKDTHVTPKPVKNNKIIILNEIISYPNQDQPVIIHNHNNEQDVSNPVPEVQNVVLKPPSTVEREVKRLVPSSPQISSDNEYPIPPPSPNKVNRSRIKAVPRLGQRNTSFSASESEDESRRNNRHRNDSVCSTASGFQDTSSISDCPSPQKPKEFSSVIQRKCRRTEQFRKLAEARRDFYIKFGNKTPDRQKLTMIDLIFYNPTTNPMSHENKRKKEDETEKKEETQDEESVDDPNKSGSDEENEMPAPQIKIGPQGEIIVDEQSLVIESKSVKKNREELEKSKVVSADFDTGYGIYKRAKRSKDWSKHETLKFYKALNTIGTDFTLMCELFPRRSRRELKMKFKKEEKINKALIDRAIMQPCSFDFNDFKHEVEMEEKELMEIEKQKERERLLKKESKKRKSSVTLKNDKSEKIPKIAEPKPKKKRALDIMNVLEDDESDADESEVESVIDDDNQDKLLQNIQKPTRSGRVPKILDRYKAPEPKSMKHEPGSLIVVASTGSNGQPVYRVCMVTGEQDRQQIGEDMESLSQALECKENGCIKSLFTLSASPLSENQMLPTEENVTIPEENNVTIPADDISEDGLMIDDKTSTSEVEASAT